MSDLLSPLPVKNPIEASVLLTEASLARKQRKSHATFIPLMVSEMPQAGDLVGLRCRTADTKLQVNLTNCMLGNINQTLLSSEWIRAVLQRDI